MQQAVPMVQKMISNLVKNAPRIPLWVLTSIKDPNSKLKRIYPPHRVQDCLKFSGLARKNSSILCQNFLKLKYHTLLVTVPWAQLVFPSATPCNEWPTSVGRYSKILTLQRVRKPAVQLKKLEAFPPYLSIQSSDVESDIRQLLRLPKLTSPSIPYTKT